MTDFEVPHPLKLLDEWRDTAFTTTLVAATLAGYISPVRALSIQSGREVARCASWVWNPPQQIYGGSRLPSHMAIVLSTGSAICTSLLASQLLNMYSGVPAIAHATFDVAVSLFAIKNAGGPSAVRKLYSQIWDWPRKNDGGGDTETSKIKDKLMAMTSAPALRPLCITNKKIAVLTLRT